MNLASKVTDLQPRTYWKLFVILLSISAIAFVVGYTEIVDPLYTAAISVIALLFACVCLILRFHHIFEWVIDITLVVLTFGHFTTLFTREVADMYMKIPVISLLFLLVLAGWWVIIYPYLLFRLYRRYKNHLSGVV